MNITKLGYLILVSLMILVTVAAIPPVTMLLGHLCGMSDMKVLNLLQVNFGLQFAVATYLVLPVAMVRCYQDRKRLAAMPDDEEPPAWWQE